MRTAVAHPSDSATIENNNCNNELRNACVYFTLGGVRRCVYAMLRQDARCDASSARRLSVTRVQSENVKENARARTYAKPSFDKKIFQNKCKSLSNVIAVQTRKVVK